MTIHKLDLDKHDPPDMNTGEPWGELGDQDLKWMLKRKASGRSMAEFLCRTRREVRKRAKELGFGELPAERSEKSNIRAARLKRQEEDS